MVQSQEPTSLSSKSWDSENSKGEDPVFPKPCSCIILVQEIQFGSHNCQHCVCLVPADQLAYSCFSHLMKRMSQNFPNGGAMDTHFANMRSLIQVSLGCARGGAGSAFVELQPESRGGDGHLSLVGNQKDLHLVPWPLKVMVETSCESPAQHWHTQQRLLCAEHLLWPRGEEQRQSSTSDLCAFRPHPDTSSFPF